MVDLNKANSTNFSMVALINQAQSTAEVYIEKAFRQILHSYPTVYMDGLRMDKTEVTQSAFQVVKGYSHGFQNASDASKGPQMPEIIVGYKEAEDYCKKVGKRLPTAEEWKKFAGPNQFATHDGKLVNDKGVKEANVNYCPEYYNEDPSCVLPSHTMKVASFPPNSHGMYDMTGNVSEWVADGDAFSNLADWYAKLGARNVFGDPLPSSVDLKGVRGGDYGQRVTTLDISFRDLTNADQAYAKRTIGFRCVQDVAYKWTFGL